MKGISPEVGHVARKCGIAHRVASHQPTGMRPPPAVPRRVGVTGLVGVMVMEAMGRDPEERAALQCERATDGQDAFEPTRSLVSALGEQTVVAHAYAPAPRVPE